MKSIKTITIASGLLVVLGVLIGLSNGNTSRNHAASINTAGFIVEELYKSERCSSCPPSNELVESIQRDAGTGKIYILAFHLAALFGLSKEKILRNETTPVSSSGFAVVELFTSEGCNTCPPADELVQKIQRDDGTGKIYILAFHVDYWDHQGWKDKFSEKEYTNRQIQYAGWLKLQTIYTPQIVVNGTTEYVGSDKRSVLRAISTGLAQETSTKLEMKAWLQDDQVHVESKTVVDDKNAELVIALIQKSAHVDVLAGENMGRSLSHVQIVRRMNRIPLDVNTKTVVAMKPPVDFTGRGWEIIGFVQQTSNGRITSAGRFDFDSKVVSSK